LVFETDPEMNNEWWCQDTDTYTCTSKLTPQKSSSYHPITHHTYTRKSGQNSPNFKFTSMSNPRNAIRNKFFFITPYTVQTLSKDIILYILILIYHTYIPRPLTPTSAILLLIDIATFGLVSPHNYQQFEHNYQPVLYVQDTFQDKPLSAIKTYIGRLINIHLSHYNMLTSIRYMV
jgi:hypothetical protein